MLDEHKTKRQLLKELDEVRQRLAELDAAESRRRQTLTELRAKETLFRGVLESAPDAIVVTDPGGRITRVNAQAEKMFGYSRDELVGQAVETLLPERLRPQHVEHRADYVSQPRPRPMGTGLKIVGRRQDGSEFPADITLSPLETEDGLLVISSIRDIAGQKQMEAELRTVNRALRTLSDCNQVLVHVANEVELLQEICRVIVEVGDYRLAWVGYVEQDAGKTVRPVADAGYEEGFLESIHLTWADTEAGSGPTGTAIRTGQPCTATDISSKSCTPWRQEARERGHASAIALPLQTEDHVFGVLNIYSAEPDAFDTEEVKLLTELADDLAYGVVALRTREERARAEERLRQQTARAEALVRIAANLNAQLDMEAVLTTVCTETAGALSVPFVTVSLYDPKRDVLEMATDFGLPPEYREHMQPLPRAIYDAYTEERGHLVITPDVQALPDLPNADLYAKLDLRTTVNISMLRNGELVGRLNIGTTGEIRRFTDNELDLLQGVADQAAIAIENARLYAETRRQTQRLAILNELAREMTGLLETEELCTTVAERVCSTLGYYSVGVFSVDPETEQVVLQAIAGAYADMIRPGEYQQALGEGIIGQAAETGEVQVVNDTRAHPGFFELEEMKLRSELAIPMKIDERVIGVLNMDSDQLNAFDEQDVAVLTTAADQLAVALQKASLFEEVRQTSAELTRSNRLITALGKVAAYIKTSTDPERIIETLGSELQRLGITCLIAEFDRQEARVVRYTSIEPDVLKLAEEQFGVSVLGLRTPRDQLPFARDLIERQQAVFASDPLQLATRALPEVPTTIVRRLASLAGVEADTSLIYLPLVVEQQALGLLMVWGPNLRADDVPALSVFANQIAVTLENARLYQAEQSRRQDLDTLYHLSRQLIGTYQIEEVLDTIAGHIVESVSVTFCRILMPKEDAFTCRAAHTIRGVDHDLRINQPDPQPAWPHYRRALGLGEPLVLNRTDPSLEPAERQALLLDVAQSLCLVPLQVGEDAIGLLALGEARRPSREFFTPDKLQLIAAIADQAANALHRARLHEEVELSFMQTVLALARTMDARDTYTSDHSERLATWAAATARELGCSEEEIKTLRWATRLHDIGKIGVPDRILRKPAALNDHEWEIMKRHPAIGAEIVAPVSKLADVAPIIRFHHERWDGSGYPEGLRGTDIPLGARILAVVDAYGAMIDERPYKTAHSPEEAVAELKRCAGTQFDPRVVEAFLETRAKSKPSS